MKIQIPNLPEWQQIGGDVNIGAYGGILARTDGDAIEVVQIQPVTEHVGKGEAQEVGYPFWTLEGWYDLDDLRKISQDRLTMGYMGLDEHIDDLTPTQRAIALAETAVQAGFNTDEGTSGWADDIDQGFPPDILESLREEDEEFRREVLGEEDDDFEPNKGIPENPSLGRLSPRARKVVLEYARREGPELGAALALARHDPRSRAVSVWTTSGSGARKRTYRSTLTGHVIDTESSSYPMTKHAAREIESYEEDLKRQMVQEFPELVEDVARAMSASMSPNRHNGRYTYSIFDSHPSKASPAWPMHDQVEIEAEDDQAALAAVRNTLRVEAAGLNPADGYAVGDRIWAEVWDADEICIGPVSYVLKAADLDLRPNRRKDPHATALANKRWHPRTDPHAAALAHKRWRRTRR